MLRTTTCRGASLAAALAVSLLGGNPEPPAQEVEAPTLVVRGGHLFDPVSATRRPLGQLWVRGERVVAEYPAGTELPGGVQILDAEGATVLPGLFDLHAHISVPGASMTRWVNLSPEDNLASHLFSGVLHVVDLHSNQATVFDLRDASRADPGTARLYAAGAAFTAPGGHGTQFGIEANAVTSTDEVDARFDALIAHRPDVIKGIVEHGGWGGLPEQPTLTAGLLADVGARAQEAGVPYFVHVWSLEEAREAIDAGATVLAHGVYLDEVTDDFLAAMKESGTAYVPTLSVVSGPLELAAGEAVYERQLAHDALHPDVFDSLTGDEGGGWAVAMSDLPRSRFLSNLKRVHDAGIPVGLGTDAGNPQTPHGPSAIHELELYVEAGLTPGEALRCATSTSAELLGVAEDFGTIAPGKVADLVLVEGDPTADIAAMWNVRAVVRAGAPVDRDAHRVEHDAARGPAVLRTLAEVGDEIDGFDDGDLACTWGGTWTHYDDSVAGGKSDGELSVVDGNLVLAGEVAEGFEWGAWSGATVDWSESRKAMVDATGATGLRLRVRGTPRPYVLTVNRAAVKDFDVFTTPIEVTEEWQELEVPFTALRQTGFGASVPWAADDLLGVAIDARNAPFAGRVAFGTFSLEVDWIRVYR